MGILHLINTGPQRTSLEACLQVWQPEDAILLLEDGVYLASPQWGEPWITQAEMQVLLLATDAYGRGLDPNDCFESVNWIDTQAFVDWTVQMEKALTWSLR